MSEDKNVTPENADENVATPAVELTDDELQGLSGGLERI
ncbi:hypothetical protein SAMN05421504_108266 [Amycolatopsis xylanica]|uniref:Uncharacterized protein n=1 Tax=Amycolatopsis xylanica TaxID=589385 RepID=A0A1H3PL87_9PSEU|nr:hypothetical protein SAMN05421504_108266 [Amycolatopsis xylanica]